MTRPHLVFAAALVIVWPVPSFPAALAETSDLPAGKPIPLRPKVFAELQVIDHHNLRRHRPDDPDAVAGEVAQVKRNMDVAAQLGFTSYLLFQEEAFPELLTWGGRHEPDEVLGQAVQDVLDHANSRKLKLYLHCNEFMWPESVGVSYGDTPLAWETYRNALKELITLYPDLAGFEVTADESSGALESREGVLKFHNETARALASDGRERLALMRTWQRVDVLDFPTTLGEGDEPNVVFSIKNTSGDFRSIHGFDGQFLRNVKHPERLLVEFDAWREYETHNIFPIYLGDFWAPRFRALAGAGVKRIGLRFNWNSGRFPITERPWANWVNVFTFVRLAENPDADPDDILREFVTVYYPPDARHAAFDLYKSSFDFVKDVYYSDGEEIADHGRVNRERKVAGKEVPADWFERVDTRTQAMMAKIDALPKAGPYRQKLQQGATVVSYLSKACGLQLDARGDSGFLAEWKQRYPESFEELRGSNAVDMQPRSPSPDARPIEPNDVNRGEDGVDEAEEAIWSVPSSAARVATNSTRVRRAATTSISKRSQANPLLRCPNVLWGYQWTMSTEKSVRGSTSSWLSQRLLDMGKKVVLNR